MYYRLKAAGLSLYPDNSCGMPRYTSGDETFDDEMSNDETCDVANVGEIAMCNDEHEIASRVNIGLSC